MKIEANSTNPIGNSLEKSVKVLSILILIGLSALDVGCAKFLADMKRNSDEARIEDIGDDSESRFDPSENESVSSSFGNPPSEMFEPPAQSSAASWNSADPEAIPGGSAVPSRAQPQVSSGVSPRVAPRVTKEDFIDQSQEEGSLWASSGQTNYYFTKNKIRSPGDIISLTIDDELHRSIAAEVKRALNPKEKFTLLREAREDFRAQSLIGKSGAIGPGKPDAVATQGSSARFPSSSPSRSPLVSADAANKDAVAADAVPELPGTSGDVTATLEEINNKANKITFSDVDISHKFGIKTGESMMGEVVGRYPNGNYKIKGIKRFAYKHDQPRLVSVMGIVKSTDINEDTDKVTPGSLYEYQIEISN